VNFTTLEDAMRAVVVDASGLASAQVIFSDQSLPSPAPAAMIHLNLGDVAGRGGVDPELIDFDEAADPGEEVIIETRGWRVLQLEIQAIAPAVTGDGTARELLSKCKTAFGQSEIRYLLTTLGVGVEVIGDVRWLPKEVGNRREGTAVLEVSFNARETALARLGYIGTVRGSAKISEGSHEAEQPFEATIED
jgi:hypothetical protein